MRFLRENKKLFFMTFILPVFLFYLDKTVVLWMKGFHKANGNITGVPKKSLTFWGALYPLFHSIDPLINFIAHGATLYILAFLIYLVGRFLNQRVYEAGKTLFIGLVASGIAVQVMKHLIGRARPRLTEDFLVVGPSLKSGYDSFPSGHTALAFTLAYILSQYLPRYRTLFYTFAIVVGFERVEDVAHFPSDVLAGALLGLIIGKLLSFKIGQQQREGESISSVAK